MLQRAGMGFGSLALASLLLEDGLLKARESNTPKRPSFPGKAASVIFLFMGGGPSQVDTWDPKPELTKLDGKDVPESIARDIPRIARSPSDPPVCFALPIHAPRQERYPGLRTVSRNRQVGR